MDERQRNISNRIAMLLIIGIQNTELKDCLPTTVMDAPPSSSSDGGSQIAEGR